MYPAALGQKKRVNMSITSLSHTYSAALEMVDDYRQGRTKWWVNDV